MNTKEVIEIIQEFTVVYRKDQILLVIDQSVIAVMGKKSFLDL